MRRLWSVLLSLTCLLALSGCSITAFDVKTLMSPPKANEDQQAIHRLLQGSQNDVTFVYPKNGEHRSAVIMVDFTGDGQEDAIGFTQPEETGGVQVRFLTKYEGTWVTVATFQNSAIQVDRVCFADFSGRGTQDTLIGWGSSSGTSGRTAAASVYAYENGEVSEYPLGVYAELAITDFDQDGVSEVFTVDKFVPAASEEETATPAAARLYSYDGTEMSLRSTVDADNSIVGYQAATFGQLNQTLWGIALDGTMADGSMTTQLFYLENGELVNAPHGVNTEEYTNPFARPSAAAFQCRDIDGDGVLELPVVTLLPGLSETDTLDSTGFMVEWRRWQRSGITLLKQRTLLNVSENYCFTLPYQLEGKLTARNDTTRRTVTYAEVSDESGEQLLGSTLFSIRAFTRSAWESRGEGGGYQLLAAQNDVVYGIQVRTFDEELLVCIEEMKKSFRLLSE